MGLIQPCKRIGAENRVARVSVLQSANYYTIYIIILTFQPVYVGLDLCAFTIHCNKGKGGGSL